LGEYTFDGSVPPEVLDWCRRHRRHLIAGGKEPLPDGTFYNTAFVVSHEGEVVFRQAKAVPIQFFNDGRPAAAQYVWRPGMRTVFNPQQPMVQPRYEWLTNWDEEDKSRWRLPATVGIAVCYDLSFALVIDRLVQAGEHHLRLLLVPAMDAVEWGAHQHRLNARMTAIRAAENRLWIFRVATSGISQLVAPGGWVVAETSFPGQGEFIVGQAQGQYWKNRIPLDRVFGLQAVVITIATLLALLGWRRIERALSQPNPTP
jgi:apolipoprotein N-acyltransferase